MDARSISLLQESVARLILISSEAEATFGARLLDTFPEVYRIFLMDVEPEERRLVPMLAMAVGRLRIHGAILPAFRELMGERKVYRIVLEHYEAIGLTLMWTLRRSLGPALTFEVERAWFEALRMTVDTMVNTALPLLDSACATPGPLAIPRPATAQHRQHRARRAESRRS